ncbi:MAG TPA: hypothetical protein VHA71_13325 [Rhodanobacteraceae bacterium]|jgi:hypothetical protein|nr:hypothetical protein [Rhodanobacteraceae bacterium]
MQTVSNRQAWTLAMLLALAMLATRTGHFGDTLHLPDASMAAFFLGGVYVRRHLAFAMLVVLGVAIDYVMIRYAGVSNYCVTPAYGFLQVAYAVLWYGGCWCASRGMSRHLLFVVAVVLAIAAFLVSDGSFYWLGGRVADRSLAGWATNAWRWGPSFVMVAMCYIGVALGLVEISARVRALVKAQKGIES